MGVLFKKWNLVSLIVIFCGLLLLFVGVILLCIGQREWYSWTLTIFGTLMAIVGAIYLVIVMDPNQSNDLEEVCCEDYTQASYM